MALIPQQQIRKRNSTRRGDDFSLETRRQVWAKGRIATGYDQNIYRLDSCGALIKWSDYGLTAENGNGWEIDHITPVALNGSDDLINLQPLQWQNNRTKGDSLSQNYCLVSFKGAA